MSTVQIGTITIPVEPVCVVERRRMLGIYEVALTPGAYPVMGYITPGGLVEDLWVTAAVDGRVARVLERAPDPVATRYFVGETFPVGFAWRAGDLARGLLNDSPEPGLALNDAFEAIAMGEPGLVPDHNGSQHPYQPAGIRRKSGPYAPGDT